MKDFERVVDALLQVNIWRSNLAIPSLALETAKAVSAVHSSLKNHS